MKAFSLPIRYSSAKLTLATNKFTFEHGGLVTQSHNNNRMACLVPVNPWLRKQLTTIENFVTRNVRIPLELMPYLSDISSAYKPIWSGDNIFISVSPWCRFVQYDPDNPSAFEKVSSPADFACGTYQIIIDIPYVYLGKHADVEKLFSISMSVVEIRYKEDVAANNVICIGEFLGEEGETKLPPQTPTTAQRKKAVGDKKKRKPSNKLDKLDKISKAPKF